MSQGIHLLTLASPFHLQLSSAMDWWEQDPEMLRILAAWDGTFPTADSESLDSNSPVDVPQALMPLPLTAPKRNVNASRERRRQEVLYLRKKVGVMERKLGELRSRREELLLVHYGGPQKTQLASAAPVWESLAKSQFQARRKSERRNAELKSMLAAQARAADDLRRAIQRVRKESSVPLPRPVAFSGVQRMRDEDQVARVQMLCSQWSNVFAKSPKFLNGAFQFCDMEIVQDNELDQVIQICSSDVVPFNVDRVEQIVWSVFKDDTPVDDANAYRQCHEESDDVMTTVFSSTSDLGGAKRGTIHGKWVLRRLAVDGGQQRVLAFHSFSQPEGFGNEMDHAVIEAHSCIRIARATDLQLRVLDSSLTVIQHVQSTRLSFTGVSNDEMNSSRIKELTLAFQQQMKEELEWVDRALENALMNRASG